MRYSLFAVAAAIISSVQALTAPVGQPEGNPIHTPGLNDLVVAGKPYTITWTPTSEGPISLVLLRGPSENVKPIATIVEGIPNSGSYSWTPSTALEDDVTHYGIQLIQDKTGFYQYSTQFGVSNKKEPVSSSYIAPPAPISSTYATPSESAKPIQPVEESPVPEAPKPTIVYSTHTSTITACDCEESKIPVSSVVVPVPAPTGSGVPPTYNNNTQPGYSAPVPSATQPASVPTFTGAANKLASGSMAVVAAGLVIALF
ncbi:GPI anchored serine-threonine rich protein [Pyronema domesticum]|nr:GPI anchored serine-threonine rich protein [Pyronema domesticum]